jgi:hypothetical protein
MYKYQQPGPIRLEREAGVRRPLNGGACRNSGRIVEGH